MLNGGRVGAREHRAELIEVIGVAGVDGHLPRNGGGGDEQVDGTLAARLAPGRRDRGIDPPVARATAASNGSGSKVLNAELQRSLARR